MNRLLTFLLLTMLYSALLPLHADTSERAQKAMAKGLTYLDASRFVEALENFTTALSYAETDNDQHTYLQVIGNIGNVYGDMGDESRAKHYYMKGYNKAKELHMPDLEYKYLVNIVGFYCVMHDLQNAKKYFKLQNQLISACPDKNNVTFYLLYNEGMIAQVEKEYSMAEYYHKKALQYVEDHNMGDIRIMSQMLEITNVNAEQKKYKEAFEWVGKAEAIAKKQGDQQWIAEIYNRKSNLYQQMGNKEEAKRLKSLSLSISDSVFNRKQFDIANNKLFEHEKQQSEKEITDLQAENRRIIIFTCFIIVIIAIVSILAVRLRRTNKRLTEMYKIMIRKNSDFEKRDRQNHQLLQQYVDKIKDNETTPIAMESSDSNGFIEENSERDQSNELLSVEQRNILLNRINNVMQDIKTISHPDFGLNILTEKVESNTRYVSWVINYAYGKNLRSLINECRIREACRLLSDTDNYGNLTIRSIYEMVGFGSASSFIQAFKKETGMSPSEYLKVAKQ